jgi:hypothetical protein
VLRVVFEVLETPERLDGLTEDRGDPFGQLTGRGGVTVDDTAEPVVGDVGAAGERPV